MPRGSPRERFDRILAKILPKTLRAQEDLERWYISLRCEIDPAVVELHDYVDAWLTREKERVRKRERSTRDVWIIFPDDAAQRTKTLESLRTKLGRDFLKKPPGRRLSCAEVEERIRRMPDLARFRIVCDFSSDVEHLLDRLLVQVDEGTRFGRYEVRGPIKDYVNDLSLRDPRRGHRARQFAVAVPVPRSRRFVLVEIQIMTLLQHAWDRRNHAVYEWSRCGGELPACLCINDVALAETLHLVDRQAAENWQEFLRLTRQSS